ncbi:MAG: VTT domain-containing protein [Bacteroidota bacterium]
MVDPALWGGPGLFVAAFVGATLVPISSEAAFVAVLASGYPVAPALVWATVGNSLGCALNYGLGRWSRDRIETRLMASRAGRTALRWTERAGVPALLLSWLPIVGDPLTLAAGVARVRPIVFATLVVSVRFGRYAALALALAMAR